MVFRLVHGEMRRYTNWRDELEATSEDHISQLQEAKEVTAKAAYSDTS